ncbi:hypothetical protein [Streptomyces sp. LaBMicrA B280]|uniref:hypothetical protein n=1 Tax=Streptomyces sp. LaBMicrA B280 TaxID=3391001 RepID=UPI003BA43091
MDTLLLTAASALCTLLILTAAAVLIVRCALTDTDSKDRARILGAVAEVVRALRGRR